MITRVDGGSALLLAVNKMNWLLDSIHTSPLTEYVMLSRSDASRCPEPQTLSTLKVALSGIIG